MRPRQAREINALLDMSRLGRQIRRKAKRSWYCEPCSTEVYTVRCKYCGKSETEPA